MKKPTAVVYLNLRRTPQEYGAALDAAHRLGHAVVLIADSVPSNLPSSLVRAVRKVDLQDVAAVDAAADSLAEEFELVGVLTWSDPPVEMASRLAHRLGLPGPPKEAARIARNKYLMREALAGYPELIPKYARVTNWAELEKAADTVGLPAVLKPTSASGSKGIFKIIERRQLRDAFDELMAFTTPERDPVFRGNPNELIFEELLLGTEHSVEGLVFEGNLHVVGVTDKQSSEPFRLETGHVFPSSLATGRLRAVHDMTATVITTFGLDNCSFHLECMIANDGSVKLVEIAARPGGDFIASHLVGLASGRPFCEDVVRVATGVAPESGTTSTLKAGVKKLMAEQSGIFRGLDGLYDSLQQPGVQAFVPERSIGARVALPPEDYMSSTIGAFIASGHSDADLRQSLERAASGLTIRIERPE